MRLTKDEFIDGINTIKKMYSEEQQILAALDTSPEWKCGEWVDNYYNLFIQLCELPENDYYGTDVDYFIYELNFGKDWKPGMVKENGEDIKLTTPEELWDFVTGDKS